MKDVQPTVHSRSADWPWWVVYIFLLMAVAGGLIAFRSWALTTYGSAAGVEEWQDWKEDATKMANAPGPVKRKAPTSMEPPGLRLARDYFVACFAGGMTLAAVLIGVILLMLRGALSTPPLQIRDINSDSRR